MNRSFRLLSPALSGRPILQASLARSTLLAGSSSRSASLFPSTPAGPSKLPALYVPKTLGVRLYVSPTSTLLKKEKNGEPKERSTVGNALAEVCSVIARGSLEAISADELRVTSEEGMLIHQAKDVVSDLASIISGGQKPPAPSAFSGTSGAVTPGSIAGGVMAAMETSSHSHPGNVKEDFMAVTTGLIQTVPRHVLLFGLAGTLPYLGTAAGTVFLAREAHLLGNGQASVLNLNYDTLLDTLHSLEAAQITYGAVILSFLGALHWGMEFVGFGGEQGYRRLMLGTAPLLFAFPTVFLSHGLALAAQWVGFTLTWFMDARATGNGWTPAWFATYRFYLSIIVGFSIIGTLAGTSFYQEGAGSDFGTGGPDSMSLTKSDRWSSNTAKEKERRESGKAKGGGQSGPIRGTVGGDVYVETDDKLEAYGRLKNRTKAAEEEEEDEEEESAGEGEDEAKEDEDTEEKDESEGESSEENEGGSAGKSQSKKDNPNEKGAAGAKNTGLR